MSLHTKLLDEQKRVVTRRWFFKECGVGLGSIALGSLLGQQASAADGVFNPLTPKKPHYASKAKRVIYLFQAGAPSHLELFDNKPELAKWNGKLPPAELLKNYRAAFINPNSRCWDRNTSLPRRGNAALRSANCFRIWVMSSTILRSSNRW